MAVRTGAPLITYDTQFDRARPARFRVFASRLRPVSVGKKVKTRRRKPPKFAK